ncbi:hypothetical protein CTAYLR_002333 [Chrysophaeum taylorii]|uniref:tRNA (guanine(46)-N(7))-methyltransferase n=1 Tax=Chrysophaeum taylorii TaxID=2483200 RepID=A0AAD7UG61_9STRA|nr:hypothetical protein CTAYLR_002333 [Chrysophaeum taylorii]
MPRRRERRRTGGVAKQVNPLKKAHGNKLDGLAPDWFERMFGPRCSFPLVIDLGTGGGEWVLEAAQQFRALNFLGLDVRDDALPAGTSNAGFLAANSADGDFDAVLRHVSKYCRVRFVLAQYPDPHWKRKHRSRAMLTPSLCRAIALAAPEAFAVRTDVPHVAEDARRAAAQPPSLLDETTEISEDLADLLAVPTERELYVRRKSKAGGDFPRLCVFRATVVDPPHHLLAEVVAYHKTSTTTVLDP